MDGDHGLNYRIIFKHESFQLSGQPGRAIAEYASLAQDAQVNTLSCKKRSERILTNA